MFIAAANGGLASTFEENAKSATRFGRREMVLDWELQDAVRRQVKRVESADRVKRSPNRVESRVIENLHGEGRARDHTFAYDEPDYVAGGQNRGPRPLEYFLAGFAFCQQVQYARKALLTGIEFDELRMETEGNVIPGQVGFADDTIHYTTHIESGADPEDVVELVRQAEDACHAHRTLTHPMTLDREILLNGEPLDA